MNVLGIGAKALKQAHGKMDLDTINDLQDDIAEQRDIANEIAEAISSPVGFGNDYHEDELMNELEELEQEGLDEALLDVNEPSTNVLPEEQVVEPSRPARPVVPPRPSRPATDSLPGVPAHEPSKSAKPVRPLRPAKPVKTEEKYDDVIAELASWAS